MQQLEVIISRARLAAKLQSWSSTAWKWAPERPDVIKQVVRRRCKKAKGLNAGKVRTIIVLPRKVLSCSSSVDLFLSIDAEQQITSAFIHVARGQVCFVQACQLGPSLIGLNQTWTSACCCELSQLPCEIKDSRYKEEDFKQVCFQPA